VVKDHKDYKVVEVQQEIQHKDRKVLVVIHTKDQVDQQEIQHKDQKVQQVQQDQREVKDLKVQLPLQDLQEIKDRKDQSVLRDQRDQLRLQVPKVQKVLKGL